MSTFDSMGDPLEPQNWCDYFTMKTFDIQQKEAFLEFPLFDPIHQLLKNYSCKFPIYDKTMWNRKPKMNLPLILSGKFSWPWRRKDQLHLYKQILLQTFFSPSCSPKIHIFFLEKPVFFPWIFLPHPLPPCFPQSLVKDTSSLPFYVHKNNFFFC